MEESKETEDSDDGTDEGEVVPVDPALRLLAGSTEEDSGTEQAESTEEDKDT